MTPKEIRAIRSALSLELRDVRENLKTLKRETRRKSLFDSWNSKSGTPLYIEPKAIY